MIVASRVNGILALFKVLERFLSPARQGEGFLGALKLFTGLLTTTFAGTIRVVCFVARVRGTVVCGFAVCIAFDFVWLFLFINVYWWSNSVA